jgi:hypothetical protein
VEKKEEGVGRGGGGVYKKENLKDFLVLMHE